MHTASVELNNSLAGGARKGMSPTLVCMPRTCDLTFGIWCQERNMCSQFVKIENGCRNDKVKTPQMHQASRVFWGLFGKSLEQVSCSPLHQHRVPKSCPAPNKVRVLKHVSCACIPSYACCVSSRQKLHV